MNNVLGLIDQYIDPSPDGKYRYTFNPANWVSRIGTGWKWKRFSFHSYADYLGFVDVDGTASIPAGCDYQVTKHDDGSVDLVATATWVPSVPGAPFTITMDVERSERILDVAYDFGDGSTPVHQRVTNPSAIELTNTIQHAYAKSGTYTVTVTTRQWHDSYISGFESIEPAGFSEVLNTATCQVTYTAGPTTLDYGGYTQHYFI
jgi:hypothetical protein